MSKPIIRVAVDSSGLVHIAFIGYTSANSTTLSVNYITLNGNTFGPMETVRQGYIPRSLALLVGSDDIPELLFDDVPGSTSSNIVSARRVSGTWNVTPTGCSVPNPVPVELAARGTSSRRILAIASATYPNDGSAPDKVQAAEAANFGSNWSCQQVASPWRNPISASRRLAGRLCRWRKCDDCVLRQWQRAVLGANCKRMVCLARIRAEPRRTATVVATGRT